MKLRLILEELSDDIKKEKAGNFKLVKQENGFFYYIFEIKNLSFKARFFLDIFEKEGRELETYEFEFSDSKDSIKTTGTGNVIEVFSTLNEILKDFYSRVPNAILVFSAEGRGRNAFYIRIIKNLEKVLPGLEGMKTSTNCGYADECYFIFPKKRKKEIIYFMKGTTNDS